MQTHWSLDSFFYAIYPLGLCAAPARNDFIGPPVHRLEKIEAWLPHMESLGVNAVYLGPVFESSAHGYDTANYYEVDRRLGDRSTLARLASRLHARGMRLVLDGVFNHVGRDFWAFRDVLQRGEASPYREWFAGLRFDGRSPFGDPFTYQGWNDHYDLVRLNLAHPDVREHLFGAIRMWVDEFDIDGLRLDVADCLDFDFMHALRSFTSSLKPDFWLMGEVVHGDYRRWVNPQTLDSVTNYEAHKGLYSSLADGNYFEIAYSLNRQSGQDGVYTGLPLYNFVDNHDVDRAAGRFDDPALLFPLHLLLFCMPGVPSIYYGSEWGLQGRRSPGSDDALRPALELNQMLGCPPQPQLAGVIARLAALRRELPALRYGDYTPLHVASLQYAFARQTPGECVVVALNAARELVSLDLRLHCATGSAVDVLNGGERFPIRDGILQLGTLHPRWGRILKLETA